MFTPNSVTLTHFVFAGYANTSSSGIVRIHAFIMHHNKPIMKVKETTFGIHIGNLINNYIKESEHKQTEVARMIGWDKGNFNRLMKEPSMDIDTLAKISIALKHNFIKDIGEVMEWKTRQMK